MCEADVRDRMEIKRLEIACQMLQLRNDCTVNQRHDGRQRLQNDVELIDCYHCRLDVNSTSLFLALVTMYSRSNPSSP